MTRPLETPMPTVHDHALALAERTVAIRRDLHAHP